MSSRGSYVVRKVSELEEDRSTCGFRKRIMTSDDTPLNSISYLHITDSKAHYHKVITEFYYVLSGKGSMELGEDTVELEEGTLVMIPPGLRHRAYGDIRTLVICNPAFDPEDQFFD